jgi:hypothetical protein
MVFKAKGFVEMNPCASSMPICQQFERYVIDEQVKMSNV